MPTAARFALAFALSLVASGAVQQAIMAAAREHGTMSALPLLAIFVALIAAVFALVLWRRRDAVGRVATAILVAFAVLGGGALAFGAATLSPGVGGNIMIGLAVILDLYFLLPATAAVAIHWWLLRRPSPVG